MTMIDIQHVKEAIETLSIDYQEEATTRWSSEQEKIIAVAQLDVLDKLVRILDLGDD